MEMEQENNNFMKKRKKASVIGIDFGNENCVVSLIDELNSNLPKIILNNLSNDRTPYDLFIYIYFFLFIY